MLFAGWSKHRPCPVYNRYDLPPRAALKGPAVVEEDEASTVVGPGGTVSVDGFGNLVIAVPAAGSA